MTIHEQLQEVIDELKANKKWYHIPASHTTINKLQNIHQELKELNDAIKSVNTSFTALEDKMADYHEKEWDRVLEKNPGPMLRMADEALKADEREETEPLDWRKMGE